MLRRFTFLGVLVAVVAVASLFGVLGRGGGKAEANPGPVTITAVNGGENPPTDHDGNPSSTASGPCAIPNVDPGVGGPPGFTINSANTQGCGDGINEFTNWNFFFKSSTSNPVQKLQQYNDFVACVNSQHDPLLQLTHAVLTLTLTNTGDIPINDGISMLAKAPGFYPGAAGVSSSAQNSAIGARASGTTTVVHDWAVGPGNPPAYPANGSILTNLFGNGTVTPANSVQVPPYTALDGTIAMQYQDDALITSARLDLTCELPPVGGVADILTGADGSAGNTLPISAAVAAAVVAIAAGGWYTRRRWLP